MKNMSHTEDIHTIRTKRDIGKKDKGNQRGGTKGLTKERKQLEQEQPSVLKCKYCGKTHRRIKEECPAWGKKCLKCNKSNHFASQCRNKSGKVKGKVHGVDELYESEDEEIEYVDYVLTVKESVMSVTENKFPKRIFAHLVLNKTNVKFQLDSGATVNVLPLHLYRDIFNDPKLMHLEKTQTTLVMFNKSKMKVFGKIKTMTINPKNQMKHAVEFLVVDLDYKPLLGFETIQRFELMTVNAENVMSVRSHPGFCPKSFRSQCEGNPTSVRSPPKASPRLIRRQSEVNPMTARNQPKVRTESEIISEYKDVFIGEGRFEEKLHLEVNKEIPPTKIPVRKVPIALKKPIKEELDRLVKLDVLTKVEVPTDWISSMVAVQKKDGSVRLCIDPKPLNKALKRNHYPHPDIEDLLPNLAKSKVFSVVDAKNGFWHVQLDQESSYLTTFATPWGRYRWKRMPFGISPAPEEFQRYLDSALEGLEGIKAICDDILVCGVGESYEEAVQDHDNKLVKLLERCRSKGIKLNSKKLLFRRNQVSFMGHLITSKGLRPDPAKVESVQNMPIPSNKQAVRRLLGMVNYLQRFSPNLSSVTAPLRELLKEENVFHWREDVEGKCFNEVKKILSSPPVLKYFDPDQEVELQCDASQKGLGACLMQDGQPVAYASRSLTNAEQHYAQIEKEMLAIVFGTEKFEQYIYGRRVKVETDHKPIESIMKKNLLSAPKRLQRMMLRLQKYHLEVTYKRGSQMYLADTLSRAYLEGSCSPQKSDEEVLSTGSSIAEDLESIDMVCNLAISVESLTMIKQATEVDNDLEKLKTVIRQGWPETKDQVPPGVAEYFNFRDELSIQNGLIFKGERLVIPYGVRSHMKARIHASHIGVQGCLRRARDSVYWPGMTKELTEYILRCPTCNAYPQDQQKEPLISHAIPERPWEKVGSDLFEYEGGDFLVTVDYFSNFFELDQLRSKSSDEVIGKLKSHFARYGVPDQFISDNGPPYNSEAFREFAREFEFEHITSSPGYPKSNGKSENAVRTAKRLVKKAKESGRDPYLSLLDWRNTPSEGIGYSPAQRLLCRRTRTLIPTLKDLLKPTIPRGVDRKLLEQKSKQAHYYNKGTKELPELKEGDLVRIKPLKLAEKRKPWVQAKVEGKVDIRSYQVRTEDGRLYRRNRQHLRHSREQPEESTTVFDFQPPFIGTSATRDSGKTPSRDDVLVQLPSDQQQPEVEGDSLEQQTYVKTTPAKSDGQQRTRSGRVVRKPCRYQDSGT